MKKSILLACTLAYIVSLVVICSADGGNVQWYRTAQNTNDRITKQSDVEFGEDFSLDTVVEIKRY